MVALEIQAAPAGIPPEAARLLRGGNRRFEAGDFEGALRLYEAALERYPSFLEAINNEGAAFGQLGRWDEALEAFNASLRINPQDATTLGNRALVQTLLGQVESALVDFARSLEIEDNYKTYNNRATLFSQQGRLQEALADLTTALMLEPEDIFARFNRSGVLLALDRIDEAFQDIEHLAERIPHDPEVIARRRQVLDSSLWRMVESGQALWSGDRPKGSKNPVKISPGTPVSDYVIQDRR